MEMRLSGEEPSFHFLNGLARMTHSQVVLWIAASNLSLAGEPSIDDVKDIGWSTSSDRERVYSYVSATPLQDDPLCAAVFSMNEPLVTRSRSEAMTTSNWANTHVRNDIHRPSGVDDSLLSISRMPGTRTSVLGFKRAWGEKPYGEEESSLVHLVHAECGWIFDSPSPRRPKARAADWSPRERDVLEMLLTGASEKMGAAKLNLSPHTFHGYVKTIYKKLRIGSRAELMALDR